MKRILNTILFSGLIVSSFSLSAMEGGKQEETKKTEDITTLLWNRLVPGFIRTRAEAMQKRAANYVRNAVAEKAMEDAAKKIKEKTPAFLKGKQVDKLVAGMIIAGVLYLACKRLAVEEDGIKKMTGGLASLGLLYLGITEFVVGGQTVKLSPKDKNPLKDAVAAVAKDVMGADTVTEADKRSDKIEPADVVASDSASVVSTTAVTTTGTVDAIAHPANGLDAFFAWFGK